MGCYYYKDSKKIGITEQGGTIDLIQMFYEDTKQLKNAAIYSQDTIQKSTYDIILNISDVNSYEKKTKTITINGEKQVINIPTVTEFIVKENKLFDTLGIKTNSGRLNPEYIVENRIKEYVHNNFDKVADVENLNMDEMKYSEDYFNVIRFDKRFQNFSDNQIIKLLHEIEDILTFEEKIKDFGNLLHGLLFTKILGEESISKKIHTFISDPKNAEIIGNGDPQIWANKITHLIDTIHSKILDIGLPISEVFLNSDIVRGKIDIIAVDKFGDAHIFDLKVSKTDYDNWDTAKINTLDWQLAMYKQLLGQHINIDNTMLYTIPVKLSFLGDPNVLYLEDFKNRSLTKKLRPEGEITVNANKILPRQIITDYDPKRGEEIIKKLHQLFKGEDYEIKTDVVLNDKNKIMKIAEDRFKSTGKWKYWPDVTIAGQEKSYISGETKEEFEKELDAYLTIINTISTHEATLLKDTLDTAIKNKTPIESNKNASRTITLNKAFGNFINNDWEVIKNVPEADAMGIIILRNKLNNIISLVSMTANQVYAKSKLNDMRYGELEIMKAFLFANEMKNELFPGNFGKLGHIIVYNPNSSNPLYIRNVNTRFDMFNKLMYQQGLGNDINLTKNHISPIEDLALYELDIHRRSMNPTTQKEVEMIFEEIADLSIDNIPYETLLDIQQAMFKKFPQYEHKTFQTEINLDDEIEVLLARLQVAIIANSGFELAHDYQHLSKYSLKFADFGDIIKTLWSDNNQEYTREGKRIEGILGGLVWTPPDWKISKDIKNINKIMSMSNQHTREWFTQVSAEINYLTREYYKSINYSDFERTIWGESQSKHKSLWELDGNKVSDAFRVKNPYVDSLENSLSDAEKSYLQNMLLIINQWRFEITDKELKNVDPTNLESIKTVEKFRKAIEEDDTYFNMPLMRREEFSKHKHWLANKTLKEKVLPYVNDINDLLDSRGLLKEDLYNIDQGEKGFYRMHDTYGHQSKDFIAKAIQEYTVDYFELNLDTIAHKLAFSKIRKKIFDRSLPIVNAYIWWLKFAGGKEQVELSNQLDSIADQIKLSVFDSKIIDTEFEDVTVLSSFLKKISSIGMLGLKVASFPKEMTIGLFKALTLGATKLYGKNEFEFKHVLQAFKKILTIDKKFASEHNLLNTLNHFYGFANMDVATMTHKMKSDRRGLMRGLSPYLFVFSTAPDFFNRMALLLAKMIKDGSYEAHSLDEQGRLVYDPTKDKRFEYYFQEREKYKKDGYYIPAENDAKYNLQRRTYLLLIDSINKEFTRTEKLTEDSIVDKAYSEEQRASLKTLSDTVFGYYEKDSQSPAHNTWWGIMFLQFMQFWPGKMKMWFAKPNEDGPMGTMKQATIEEDGQIKNLWREVILDEEGNPTFDEYGELQWRQTTEDTGDPLLEFSGNYYEGLMYSVLRHLGGLVTLNPKKAWGTPYSRKNLLFAAIDGLAIWLLFKILGYLISGYIETHGEEGLSGIALRTGKSINSKITNEYNVWQSTFAAPNSTPLFLEWSSKLSGEILDVIRNDKEFMEVLQNNFGAAEVSKWINPIT